MLYLLFAFGALSAPFCKKRHQKLLARRLVVTLPSVVVGGGLYVGLESRVPCSMQGIEAVVCGVPLKRAWRLATSSTLRTLRFCGVRHATLPIPNENISSSQFAIYFTRHSSNSSPPNTRRCYPNLSSPKLGEVPRSGGGVCHRGSTSLPLNALIPLQFLFSSSTDPSDLRSPPLTQGRMGLCGEKFTRKFGSSKKAHIA